MERALRKDFAIAGWTALKELECEDKGYYIILTEEQNFDLARKARLDPVTNMSDALAMAYQKCGSADPKITVMPQPQNVLCLR